jgi:hypothetical protein
VDNQPCGDRTPRKPHCKLIPQAKHRVVPPGIHSLKRQMRQVRMLIQQQTRDQLGINREIGYGCSDGNWQLHEERKQGYASQSFMEVETMPCQL